MRKIWEVEENALVKAAKEERKAVLMEKRERRRERIWVKNEMKLARKQYVKEQQEIARRMREEKEMKTFAFHEKKREVLKRAREEMLEALIEDENLWGKHPREMMNRRYSTFYGKRFLSPYN